MDQPARTAPDELVQSRHASEQAAAGRPLADGVIATVVDAGGVPARWYIPDGVMGGPVVLYFHGGGFRQGSAAVWGNLTSHVAALTGFRVLSVDYRLAPEHPFPSALDDAVAAHRWLGASEPVGTTILVAGDSAGGGLAAGLLLESGRVGLPEPAALGLVSPWLDLRLTAESYTTSTDVVFPLANAREAAELYLHGHDAQDPRVSPLLGEWAGRPPVFVAVSRTEALRDDADTLVERITAGRGSVEYLELDDAAHGWWMQYPATPDSRLVVQAMCAFLRAAATR